MAASRKGRLRMAGGGRQGTCYNSVSGERYAGEWKDDKRNGNGIHHYANGDRYDGEWKEHKENGTGTFQPTQGAGAPHADPAKSYTMYSESGRCQQAVVSSRRFNDAVSLWADPVDRWREWNGSIGQEAGRERGPENSAEGTRTKQMRLATDWRAIHVDPLSRTCRS
jgi:hypothetical protein